MPKTKTHWTSEQDAYLRINYTTSTFADMIGHLGKTEKAIRNRAARLKLPHRSMSHVPWNKGMTFRRPDPPPVPPELELLVSARARMKERPGPISRGYRTGGRFR